MKIKIPNDFSGKVKGRNCDGEFPEWEVDDDKITPGYMEFSGNPEICDNCPHINGCRMQVSSIIMPPGLTGDRDQFNDMSRFFALAEMFRGMNEEVLEAPDRTIEGEYEVRKEEE